MKSGSQVAEAALAGKGAAARRPATLRGRLEVAFMVLIVLFAANAGVALWAAHARDQARGRVDSHLEPARLGVEQLSEALVNEETGERGYVLTGDATLLQPYSNGVIVAEQTATSLMRNLSGETGSLSALSAVEAAAASWNSQAARPDIAARTAGTQSPSAVTASALRANTLFDSLESKLAALRSDVTAASHRESAAQARADAWLGRTVAATFLIAFGLVVAVFLLLRRSLTAPLDRLVASISAVAGGDLEHPVVATGPVEFQLVGRAAERMRTRLSDEASEALQNSLVIAQEHERLRVAAEIHHDSVQALTAVSLRLQRLRRRMTGDQTGMLSDAETAVAGAIGRLRRLIFELHPPTLEQEGLVAAVKLYLSETFGPLGVEWTVEDGIDPEPDRATQALAYRVLREALTNVAKHARCRHVSVQLVQRNDGLSVRVIDDGVGFDANRADSRTPGHLGLIGADTLVRAAGGWRRIWSAPGAGTTVEFWLPTRVTPTVVQA